MITSDLINFPDLVKGLGMEAEPCKLQEEKEEEMEEGVGEDRNMLVLEEGEQKADEMGAGGREAPLTILIPSSPPPPCEPGGLDSDTLVTYY